MVRTYAETTPNPLPGPQWPDTSDESATARAGHFSPQDNMIAHFLRQLADRDPEWLRQHIERAFDECVRRMPSRPRCFYRAVEIPSNDPSAYKFRIEYTPPEDVHDFVGRPTLQRLG